MERNTPVRKPHTSTANLLTWSENLATAPGARSAARSHQEGKWRETLTHRPQICSPVPKILPQLPVPSLIRRCDFGSLNATLARGKVVLCFQSRPQTNAARTVQELEGIGVIFAQFPMKDVALSFSIPCVQVDFAIGTYLLTYMETISHWMVFGGQVTDEEVESLNKRGPAIIAAAAAVGVAPLRIRFKWRY